MKDHHLPFFSTGRDPSHASAIFECAEEHPAIPEGLKNGEDKQELTAITQDLGKPIRVNFSASSLVSSPREISHLRRGGSEARRCLGRIWKIAVQ